MMHWLLIVLAFLAAGAAAPAHAQQRAAPGCGDDRGVDRCSPEQQRRVLALFGMKPVEEHARAGERVRRVFYVDGYGRDVVAIAFVRAPGRDPTMSVHFPGGAGVEQVPPATALVPAESWQRVLSRSAHFDRDLQPRLAKAEEVSICLHGWVYTVEGTDPAGRNGQPMEVTRKVQGGCNEGLAAAFANEAADLALPLLPYCAALDPDQHRNAASRLRACQALQGDRLAAAEAYNRLSALRFREKDDEARIKTVFRYDGALDWGGQEVGGTGAAAGAWLQRTAEGGRATFYLHTVRGEAVDRARATGELVRQVEEGGRSRQMSAPVTLVLEARNGVPLQVSRATVGAFRERAD